MHIGLTLSNLTVGCWHQLRGEAGVVYANGNLCCARRHGTQLQLVVAAVLACYTCRC